jgi:hypothetical protein
MQESLTLRKIIVIFNSMDMLNSVLYVLVGLYLYCQWMLEINMWRSERIRQAMVGVVFIGYGLFYWVEV